MKEYLDVEGLRFFSSELQKEINKEIEKKQDILTQTDKQAIADLHVDPDIPPAYNEFIVSGASVKATDTTKALAFRGGYGMGVSVADDNDHTVVFSSLHRKLFYCTCSTAAATAAKVLECDDASFVLEKGVVIAVWFTYSNSASNVTFSVNGGDAVRLAANSTRPYTSTATAYTGTANYIHTYVYDGTYWVYMTKSADSDTLIHNRIGRFNGKTGSTYGVSASGIFMRAGDGSYQTLSLTSAGSSTSTTSTTKKANPTGFMVGSSVWYTTTTYAANVGIDGDSVVYSAYSNITMRYAFNVTSTGVYDGLTLVAGDEIYIVGTIHADGLFYLDSKWMTTTPNDTSKVYVHVGTFRMLDGTVPRWNFLEQNDWLRYDGLKLVKIGAAPKQVIFSSTTESRDAIGFDISMYDYVIVTGKVNSSNSYKTSVVVTEVGTWYLELGTGFYTFTVDSTGILASDGTNGGILSVIGVRH